MDMFSHNPFLKRFVERHVQRLEDEYEVYAAGSYDNATRHARVLHTGTELSCQTFLHVNRTQKHLRIRPTGQKTSV